MKICWQCVVCYVSASLLCVESEYIREIYVSSLMVRDEMRGKEINLYCEDVFKGGVKRVLDWLS